MKLKVWSASTLMAALALTVSPAQAQTTVEGPPHTTTTADDTAIWESPIGYIALAGLLGIELGVRRRGLAKPPLPVD
ncbi:MAG: hypothetical protein GY724_08750 [Actinomycetia bacterium]|nr:hypothetical protein [Actinomycetes bacterium]MCP5034628.1 hypothetical protein [Actinomycetes bacterium]